MSAAVAPYRVMSSRRVFGSIVSLWMFLSVAVPSIGFAESAQKTPAWESCDCALSQCGPCEEEQSISFYSMKCGENGSRVKSCKKPKCVPVENQPACLADLKARAGQQNGALAKTPQTPAGESKSRTLSAVGEVVDLEGAIASVVRATGPVEKLSKGSSVYVGDRIETGMRTKVKVLLKDQSEMIVNPSSNVRVEGFKMDKDSASRKVLLNLLNGKVRARVQKKLDAESEFKVKTRTAVAGVRGTDFVASFTPGEKEWVSEVRTIEGLVRLESVQKPSSSIKEEIENSAKAVEIPAGTFASLVIGPPANPDSEEEFFKSIEEGYLSPVIKMNEAEIQELQVETDIMAEVAKAREADRQVASVRGEATQVASVRGDTICSTPAGQLKQCSYTCEGNPKGEKRCRTDLDGVACVRRMCNANGKWAELTRLPASAASQCEVGKPQVRDCDSYW